VYETTGRPKTAFRYYVGSLDASERAGDVAGQARIWLDLQRLFTNANLSLDRQHVAAVACYRTALRLARSDVEQPQKNSTTMTAFI